MMILLKMKGETQIILTQSQGHRLAQMLKLMRPDWGEQGIVKTLRDANKADGLPAHDFDHAIRAVAHYATEQAQAGGYAKRTPAFLAQNGKHWETTAPAEAPKPKMPQCEDHDGQDAHTCRACIADIALGDRKPELQGKRLHEGKRTPPPLDWRTTILRRD